MNYKLVYTHRAVKDIKKLDKETKDRIGTTLFRFKDNPLKHARKLTHSSLGSYRFRIGNYRVIFDIEEDDIVILRVGHRKEIYK